MCISPSRSLMQVHALKQSAATNPNQSKIVDVNVQWKTRPGRTMPIVHGDRTVGVVKVKADSQTEDKTREQKILTVDEEKINSRIKDGPREKGAFCSSAIVDANGCKSETKSLNNNLDTVMVIDSSAEYSRRPPPGSCWTGCFLVKESGSKSTLGKFKAYFPSKVSAKVYDTAKRMPINLSLEVLPRINDWPKSFEAIRPVHEDIGLFFFASELDWREKKHPQFLEADYVMTAYINGIKLLIYSPNVLPPDSQWIDGESYFWGIFVRSKGKSNPQRFGSAST
ncbi:hypothetical protein ACP4OV_027835 [Aristida adscensionis]